MNCEHCGAQLDTGATVCPHCGKPASGVKKVTVHRPDAFDALALLFCAAAIALVLLGLVGAKRIASPKGQEANHAAAVSETGAETVPS